MQSNKTHIYSNKSLLFHSNWWCFCRFSVEVATPCIGVCICMWKCICRQSRSVFPKPRGSVFEASVVLSALSCPLNQIPLVVAGRLFQECPLALVFKPTVYIPLCKLNMKPKSQNDFPCLVYFCLFELSGCLELKTTWFLNGEGE